MISFKVRPPKPVVVALGIALAFVGGVYLGHLGVVPSSQSIGSTINTDLPDDLDYSSVEEIYDLLRSNYDGNLSPDELLEGIKSGLVNSLGDPYTEYLTALQSEAFYRSLEGSFSGIGAQLGEHDDGIIVVAPLEGYPAEEAGLRPRDRIIAVDDKDISGLSITEVVTLIRGEVGTDVTLTINREGQEAHMDITITRDVIDIPSVKSTIDDGIGVIRVIQFAVDTVDLAQGVAEEMIQAEVDGIILDLRSNPGGYLDQAVGLAGLWLEDGQVVVKVRQADGSIQEQHTAGRGILHDTPLVVLVDEGSASASEIVAGALRDHGVARLVGQQTFGKGSVQTLEELEENGAVLKLTIARWLTPSGTGVDGLGLTPDVVVSLPSEGSPPDQDIQLERARSILLPTQ